MGIDNKILEDITSQNGFKIIREHAIKIHHSRSAQECFSLANELYKNSDYRVEELGVFLFGYAAKEIPDALVVLRDKVSKNSDWRVQEILAMAFDSYCAGVGYENALAIIREWLSSDNANTRRAVTEGLRIWTSRPYFKEHPDEAIAYIAPLRSDESEYVRKSVGNSLKDISKKHPDLIRAELDRWDASSKEVLQVYKLAGKLLGACL
ncbi:MAG: DNA alkylation repair protein [Acetanaerobacterium sp.]